MAQAGDTVAAALIEAFEYCDTRRYTDANLPDRRGQRLPTRKQRNLLGQAVRHRDPSGLATVDRIDSRASPRTSPAG